ncbi:hypothetical protein SAMN04489716_3159 [Actinoplanes derwentensis]|uniref:Uncharacterized protein n=2 Tax=Actinoplanes derwentensis TaxID=113562 RepID=A0A1H1Z609_9ACTN|nr:hypothetical protein Ade03nite_03760 [Actinoplanes derwentensis]SDT29128.1 hypothetical protein SAMN04489716_3159 [Actinoplanes derwentensis]
MHDGGPIAELDEDDTVVGIPFLCLSDAMRAVAELDRLHMLVTHRAVRVLSDGPWSWRAHAATRDVVGLASAVLAAMNDGVPMLTCHSGLYEGINNGNLAIEVPD